MPNAVDPYDLLPTKGNNDIQSKVSYEETSPYDQLPNTNAPTPKQMEEAPEVDDKGEPTAWQSFNDKLIKFNRGFERLAEGGLQLMGGAVEGIGEGIGYFAPSVGNYIAEDARAFKNTVKQVHDEKEQAYDESWRRSHGVADYAVDITGNVGAGVVALAPTLASAPATIGGRVAYGAMQGAGLSGLQYADNNAQRVQNMGVGALVGGAGQGLIEGVSKAANLFLPSEGVTSYVKKLFAPHTAAIDDVATRVKTQVGDDPQAVLNAVKLAKEKGVNLSPAQAVGGEELINLEKNSIMPEAIRAKTGAAIQQSEANVKGALHETIDKMSNGHTKASVKQLYDQLDQLKLKPETVETLKSNPIIKKEMDSLLENGNARFKSYSDDSLIKFDEVKRAIDQKIKWSNKPGNASLDPTQKGGLKDARKQIVDLLDSEYGDIYPQARLAAQQKAIGDKYNNLLSEKGIFEAKSGTGLTQTIDRINKVLFKTPEKVKAFLDDVELTGGDKDRAREVINLVKQSVNNPAKYILERAPEGIAPSIPTNGGSMGFLKETAKRLTTKGYKKALFEVMMSGNKWADEVAEVLAKRSKQEQQTSFFSLLSKIADSTVEPGSAATQTVNAANAAHVANNVADRTERGGEIRQDKDAPQGMLNSYNGERPKGMLWGY